MSRTRDEIISCYPELISHHEYCREMFISAKMNMEAWQCYCKTLRAYDEYMIKTDRYILTKINNIRNTYNGTNRKQHDYRLAMGTSTDA